MYLERAPSPPSRAPLRHFQSPHTNISYHWSLSVSRTEVVIAPPALYLLLAREHLRSGLEVAAQNVFDRPNGAFTGEISASQLVDSGIHWVVIGHSERRTVLGEQDQVRSHTPARGNGRGDGRLRRKGSLTDGW